jgi:hypothetical protein
MSRSTRDVSPGYTQGPPIRPVRAQFSQIRDWGLRGIRHSQRLGRIARSQSRALSGATWRFLAACEGRP